MEPYDWYNEVGYKDSSALKPGVRVLYEEHALFPEYALHTHFESIGQKHRR